MEFDRNGYISGAGFQTIKYKSPSLPAKWKMHGDAVCGKIGDMVTFANEGNPVTTADANLLSTDNQNRRAAFNGAVTSQYKEKDATQVVKTKTRSLRLPLCPDSKKQLGGITSDWQGPDYKTLPDMEKDSMKLKGELGFVITAVTISDIDAESIEVDVPFFFKKFEFPVLYPGQQIVTTTHMPKKKAKRGMGFAAALKDVQEKRDNETGDA